MRCFFFSVFYSYQNRLRVSEAQRNGERENPGTVINLDAIFFKEWHLARKQYPGDKFAGITKIRKVKSVLNES